MQPSPDNHGNTIPHAADPTVDELLAERRQARAQGRQLPGEEVGNE